MAVNFEIFYQPTETWFEVHAYPSDVGLGIYFQDIDERKRTELARISAEREIDRFFDISIDLLGVVNSIDEFASPTLQAALLAGKPIAISDVIADPLTAAHSDNYRQVGIRAFASIPCLDEEGRWVMTLHLNTSQNARIWRDDEIKLMQTLVTQLWSFVAEARAVLALRAQEQQTRAAQAIIGQQLGEIESIYQMAPVGLCFVDTDFRYVRIDEQLALINGVSVAEHIGQTLREVLPEVADAVEPVYRQVQHFHLL